MAFATLLPAPAERAAPAKKSAANTSVAAIRRLGRLLSLARAIRACERPPAQREGPTTPRPGRSSNVLSPPGLRARDRRGRGRRAPIRAPRAQSGARHVGAAWSFPAAFA